MHLFPAENLFLRGRFSLLLLRPALRLLAETDPQSVFAKTDPQTVRQSELCKSALRGGVSIKGINSILVVEDSEDNREILRHLLRASGYGVLEAVNGKQAVEICQDKHPDLILMDLSMPVLDGYGAAEQIRALAIVGDVPIIAVSAHATLDYRNKAFAVGFNDYLTKPIDFAHLETVLHRYLKAA